MQSKKTNLRLPNTMKESILYSLGFHFLLVIISLITIYSSPPKPVMVQVVNLSLAVEDKKDTSAFDNNKNPLPSQKNQANKAKELKKEKVADKVNPKPKKEEKTQTKSQPKPFERLVTRSEPKKVENKPIANSNQQNTIPKPNLIPKPVPTPQTFNAPIPTPAPALNNSPKPVAQPQSALVNNALPMPQPKQEPQPIPAPPSNDDVYLFDEKKERKKEFEAKKQALDNSNFDDFLNQSIDSIPDSSDDILSAGNLTDKEKQIFQSQVKRCWIANDYIKDGDLIIKLKFRMNPDGGIGALSIDTTNIPDQFKQSVEETIESIFSQEECQKLLLPARKYNTWKNFSIKLNLKGFF